MFYILFYEILFHQKKSSLIHLTISLFQLISSLSSLSKYLSIFKKIKVKELNYNTFFNINLVKGIFLITNLSITFT